MKYIEEDIISAIATASFVGAISIVRVSGKGSIELVNKIFKGKDLTKVSANTINFGYIVDQNEVVDEVLVSVFRAPKSFTAEDTVEINCHGGLFITNKIYELTLLAGARSAKPGEFTKRAYLNGRIDLTKAEAVMDMIDAQNNYAVKMATNGLLGHIYQVVQALRDKLFKVIGVIDVNIDYPEYEDIEELTSNEILPQVLEVKKEIDSILAKSKSAKYLKNGITTAIIGRPNVGKSSLLNALLEEQKAIVTSIPGTTRDTIEASVNIGNLTLNLVDTAGIRDTVDEVEKIGVEKSLKAIEKAEFVLFIVDGSTMLTKEDEILFEKIKNIPHQVIVNKKDLGINLDLNKFKDPIVITTKDSFDIEELRNKISLKFIQLDIDSKDATYLSNARQIEKLSNAKASLEEALQEIEEGAFIDFVEISLRAAWMYLGEIIGESSTEDLLNELFSKFCLGK